MIFTTSPFKVWSTARDDITIETIRSRIPYNTFVYNLTASSNVGNPQKRVRTPDRSHRSRADSAEALVLVWLRTLHV